MKYRILKNKFGFYKVQKSITSFVYEDVWGDKRYPTLSAAKNRILREEQRGDHLKCMENNDWEVVE